jgi:hypothetical protein
MQSVVKDYPKFSINLNMAVSSAKVLNQQYDWCSGWTLKTLKLPKSS